MILLILLMLLCPTLVQAATYYVGQAATGAGTGTSVSNLCGGVDDADCLPAAGDTVYLCGAFTTQIQLSPTSPNGTAGSPITYEWDCPGNPALLTFDGSADRGFFLSSKTYITVNNARVTGLSGSGGSVDSGLLSVLTSTHIILNNPTTYNNTAATNARGLVIRNSSDVTVNNAVSYGNHNHGIWIINTSTRITIAGFTVYDNWRVGLKFEGLAQTDMSYSSAYNGVAYGNGDGCYAVLADHITFHDIYAHDNTNVLSDGEGYGCAIQQVKDATMYLMVLDNNRSSGAEVWGNAAFPSHNCRIFANVISRHTHYTLDDTGSNGLKVRTGYSNGCLVGGNVFWGNTRNVQIGQDPSGRSQLVNNTMYGGVTSLQLRDSNQPGSDPTTGWLIANNIFDSPSSDWLSTSINSGNLNTFSHNNYAGSKQATYNNVVYTAGTISTIDSTALTVTPSYIGSDRTVGRDFRLTPGSSLVQAGINLRGCKDARYRVCPSIPNIGAWQFTSGDPLPSTRTVRP